jgi:hypothetical protein
MWRRHANPDALKQGETKIQPSPTGAKLAVVVTTPFEKTARAPWPTHRQIPLFGSPGVPTAGGWLSVASDNGNIAVWDLERVS